jgi:multidrug efflux pump
VRDELFRVEGVSDINVLGERDYSIRAWLDPQKLAARNMTALDVAAAIHDQNVEAAAGQLGQSPIRPGQPFQLPLDTLGRLRDAEQFGNIIVKVGRGAPIGDVAPPPVVLSRPHKSSSGSSTGSSGGMTGSLVGTGMTGGGSLLGDTTGAGMMGGTSSGAGMTGGIPHPAARPAILRPAGTRPAPNRMSPAPPPAT